MERLTLSDYGKLRLPPPVGTKEKERPSYMDLYCRLAAIEDILSDKYNLDRLRELVEADRDGRCIVLPFKLFVGQKIWVIEPESRTGQEKQAWLNTIKAFGHEKIFYQHSGCPVYSETFDNIGKTIFLNHEDAEAALKGEQDG